MVSPCCFADNNNGQLTTLSTCSFPGIETDLFERNLAAINFMTYIFPGRIKGINRVCVITEWFMFAKKGCVVTAEGEQADPDNNQ